MLYPVNLFAMLKANLESLVNRLSAIRMSYSLYLPKYYSLKPILATFSSRCSLARDFLKLFTFTFLYGFVPCRIISEMREFRVDTSEFLLSLLSDPED